ncbi:MAG: OmpA family protein [Myxococcales bacterium]|nr:OmpA family protein [Myxococcales bacterium]
MLLKEPMKRWAVAALVATSVSCANAPDPMFIHYDTGVDIPRGPQEYVTIGRVLEVLESNADLHVLVIGHADMRGTDDMNRLLSLRRARGVRAVLLERNVSAKRVLVGARGSSEPIASNRTPKGQARNRRTEAFFFSPNDGDVGAQYHTRFSVRIEVHDQ